MGFHSFAAGVLLGAYLMGAAGVFWALWPMESARGAAKRVLVCALFGALWPLIVVLVVTGR